MITFTGVEEPETYHLDIDTEELKLYQSDLKVAAENDFDVVFSNSGLKHAAILLSTIFNNAKKELLIYAATLRSELTSCDIYYYALRNCINRGVTVKVLLKDEPDEAKSPARKWLEKMSEQEGSVKVYSVKDLDAVMQRHSKVHFTVADGKMFRLEFDRENFKAFGSLNDHKVSESLRTVFNGALAQLK